MKAITIYILFLTFIPAYASIWDTFKKGAEQVTGCAEVVGLGTAYAAAQGALETAKLALNSAQIVGNKAGLESAQLVLKGAEQSSLGVLTLADAITKGLGSGFNITCVRFFGSIEKLEFELNAIILGKSVKIRESVNFNNVKSFAEKIFNKLKDEAAKIIKA